MEKTIAKIKIPLLVFLHDTLMIPIAWFLAYWIRFSIVGIKQGPWGFALYVFPFLLLVQIISYWYFGLYRGVWRFASLPDLVRIIKAVFVGSVIVIGSLFLFTRLQDIPRAIFPIYITILVVLLGGSRFIYRYFKEHRSVTRKNKRTLIIGAGQAGELLVRDLLRASNHDYLPVAFVDDDLTKQGQEIHRVRVVGTCFDIKKIVNKFGINFAIIALPSASAEEMRKIVETCRSTEIEFQTLPSISELATHDVTVGALREVDVADLLGREQVKIDWQEVQKVISGKVVLISGGGGSIGSEICRQVAKLKPKSLVVFERAEFNLYQIEQEIRNNYPELNFITFLGSVADKLFVKHVLSETHPDMIFHAAAYKHVPILESQVYSAIANNVVGTKILAEAAIEAGVKKFVMVSTDKAVRPTNVMGATKRLAEMICQSYNCDKTQFITTRFGNVLGSSGSVVPLFKKQLATGGPLTVTHPDITRYFMTIPEAVVLILQTCVLGNGGEIFVLDMGEPIKITYLAEQIIRLSGKQPGVDVQIVYTGLRPGEKMHEELFYQNEEMVGTGHKKVFRALSNGVSDGFNAKLHSLEKELTKDNYTELLKLLQQLVPEFHSVTLPPKLS